MAYDKIIDRIYDLLLARELYALGLVTKEVYEHYLQRMASIRGDEASNFLSRESRKEAKDGNKV